ncbi:hypothetical protein [Alishewanella longhuensis]
MKAQKVNEQQFKDALVIWHRTGRSLVNLPSINRLSSGISVSVVSIDNTVQYTYEQSFKSYRDVLCWYGEMLDKLNESKLR